MYILVRGYNHFHWAVCEIESLVTPVMTGQIVTGWLSKAEAEAVRKQLICPDKKERPT